jgi:hypothetical protein
VGLEVLLLVRWVVGDGNYVSCLRMSNLHPFSRGDWRLAVLSSVEVWRMVVA